VLTTLREIHALQAGECSRQLRQRARLVDRAGHDAAGLRAFFAQQARQAARVDLGDADHVAALIEVIGQRLLAAEVAGRQRQVADDQPGGPDPVGLLVLAVHAGVADVRIGQRDDLPRVGRVGQDLLVTRHRGIEHHFASALAEGSDRHTTEHTAVFKRENGRPTQLGSQWILLV
jgi:hypothetical protein